MAPPRNTGARETPLPGLREEMLALPWGRMRLLRGGRGPALLLLHGLGGSCMDFAYLAPELARSHSLFIPDLMGHGDSDKPDAPYTIDWHLSMLEAMCDRLGIGNFYLAGHSIGGQLALMLALRRPELVRRLALICPAGGQHGPLTGIRLLDLLTTGGSEHFWFPPARFIQLYMLRLTPFHDCPEMRALSARLHAQWSGPERRAVERAFVRLARSLLKEPAWPLATGLRVPVLHLWGRRDLVVPEKWTRRLWQSLPHQLRIGMGLDCGHMPVYTRHRLLTRLLRVFLPTPVD